jgi:hypothetical protein
MPAPADPKVGASWNRSRHAFTAVAVISVLFGVFDQEERWVGPCFLTATVTGIGAWLCDRRFRRLQEAEFERQFDVNAQLYPELLLLPPDWTEPSQVPDGIRVRVFDAGNGDFLQEIDDCQLRVLIAWAARWRELTGDFPTNNFLLVVEDLELMEIQRRDPGEIALLRHILSGRHQVLVHWITVPDSTVTPAP